MAEKILNTRIQSKIDTLENWNKSTIGLLKGEIAIATVAAEAGNGLTEPVYMMKVGVDGKKTFSELDWNMYAKASDVLAVCKNEEALEEYINSLLQDIPSGLEDLGFAKKTDINLSLETYNDKPHCIVVRDAKGEVLSYLEAADFVKDGMLTNVEYDKDTNELVLTWNTDSGKDDVLKVPLTGLFNIYTGGDHITITDDGVISLSESFLTDLSNELRGKIASITTNNLTNSKGEEVVSGLIATKNQDAYNIAIDDSVTFIFNCGDAGVTA